MRKIVKKQKNISIKSTFIGLISALLIITLQSCENNILPEAGSIPDKTPPEAKFSATQSIGAGDVWKVYSFSNQSSSATKYSWDFGDGNTSTSFEPTNTFPGEGTYSVSLTATDNLEVKSTKTESIVIVKPIAAVTPDPTLINFDFTKLPKSSGSDCACSGWINKSLGSQGESTSGNGGSNNVIKFDNDEQDAAYQEFEVTPNADYTIKIVVGFDSSTGGSYPSVLETRVLAGSGYKSGYSPTYYTKTEDFPQDGFGYESVSQMETAANNLLTKTLNHPGNKDYTEYTYTFNAGNNTSVALFIRGIGGDGTPSDNKGFLYNNGDEEIQVDSVTITAN